MPNTKVLERTPAISSCIKKTSEVHTLQLPVAQSRSPAPSCSDKMNKMELKNSEQRFPGVLLLLLACFYFWPWTLQLLEMSVSGHYVNLIFPPTEARNCPLCTCFKSVKSLLRLQTA